MRNSHYPSCPGLSAALAALTLLAALALAACTGAPAMPADHERAQSRAAVQELLDAFASGPFMAFADQVSQEFSPVRGEFLSATDNARNALSAARYEFFVDQALMRGRTMAVSVTWNRTAQMRAGQDRIKGRSEFVFQAEEGQWKLIQLKGDNPF